MAAYADSSFIASCHLWDAHSAQAGAYLAAAKVRLPFSSLHALEVWNACQLNVFRRRITAEEARTAWRSVRHDLRRGRLRKTVTAWPVTLRVALRLCARYSKAIGTRSLDILHVAEARNLHATDFISFDARQRELAQRLGIKVGP